MNMRLKLLSIMVPLAIVACNAYATPHGVVVSQRRRGLHARQPLAARAVSAGTRDLGKLVPNATDNKAVVAGQNQETASISSKRITGIIISSAVALSLVASSALRELLIAYSASLLENYKVSMVRFPLHTKVGTGATLAVLGDALAQMRDPQLKSYNSRRAASFAAFDSCYRCFQHNAFPYIISICQGHLIGNILSALPGVSVGSNLRLGLAALERTLVYQLLVIPLFYYPIFFSFTGYLQGLKPREVFLRAKTNFLPCWKRNLLFWIPTQMVMFGLIDEKWQIPFACVMGMLWSMILSVTAGNANKKA
jgi:Mpv17 / PMP22 family